PRVLHSFPTRRSSDLFFLQAYLIKKQDKNKAIRLLTNQNLNDFNFPESSNPLQLINREKFWSPAYNDLESEKKWYNIEVINLKRSEEHTSELQSRENL